MHRKIILLAFEEAKQRQKLKGILNPSTNQSAKFLSNYIDEKSDFSFTSRRLRDYYNIAIKEEENELEIKQPKVLTALCCFLGHKGYEDFVSKEYSKNKDEDDGGYFLLSGDDASAHRAGKAEKISKTDYGGIGQLGSKSANGGSGFGSKLTFKMKVIISICMMVLAGTLIFISVNKQKWMVWEENHYVVAPFDAEKVQNGELKLYKENRIDNFRRITADCNTEFFSATGSIKIWYGKNKDGVLEYFTDLGLHPRTGKTLKPITKYMIVTHICETYGLDE